MRTFFFSFIAAAMLLYSSELQAQNKKDACSVITTAQINKTIGCSVQDGKSTVGGKRCDHRSADAKTMVSLEYYDWKSNSTAANMLKMTYDEATKNISQGKKAVGIYTAIKPFPAGGQNALIMTGEGDAYTNGNVVRIQFVADGCTYTFDTQGIDKSKVVSKADELYKMITGK